MSLAYIRHNKLEESMILRNPVRRIGLFAWSMFLLAVMLLMLTELPKVPLGMIALSFIGLALLTMRNHTRRIGSMLLLVACAMFTAYTASADAIVAPMPIPTGASEAVSGDTMTVDMVIYEITLAELKMGGIDENIVRIAPTRRSGPLQRIAARRVTVNPPPPSADTVGGLLVPFLALQRGDATGFTFSASRDAIHVLLDALGTDNFSVLSTPQVTTAVGIPAHVVQGIKPQLLGMKVLPVRLEDGKVFTEIAVEWTKILDGKEVTNQVEMSVDVPTDNGTSLITGRKLGDKEILLIVTAYQRQDTVPVAVAQSIYCPQ